VIDITVCPFPARIHDTTDPGKITDSKFGVEAGFSGYRHPLTHSILAIAASTFCRDSLRNYSRPEDKDIADGRK
jgi:hypothetical protein